MTDALIVFTRFPVPGRTKTRLIPCLGETGAAELQRRMTEFTVHQAAATGVPVEVRWTGGTERQMRTWLGCSPTYRPQGDGNLGRRMATAFQDAFARGARRVVIVGTDCPDDRTPTMRSAFAALDNAEIVLGPADDGGYYLVGLNRFVPELFEAIPWGTADVLEQTLRRTSEYRTRLLPALHDVDVAKDVPPRITVVIPTLNEADRIANTLDRVRAGFDVETVVADGGSTDDTVARARTAGANVLQSGPPRARQLNAGARATDSPLLLFLHADTRLGPDWDLALRAALAPGVALGAFRFALDRHSPALALVERGTNLRARLLRQPYGDQGLFMTRDTFEALGGFPDLPIMDDYALVRRARRRGRVVTIDPPAVTSARRWQQRGITRTFLLNQCMLALYHAGICPTRLARLYRR